MLHDTEEIPRILVRVNGLWNLRAACAFLSISDADTGLSCVKLVVEGPWQWRRAGKVVKVITENLQCHSILELVKMWFVAQAFPVWGRGTGAVLSWVWACLARS